MGDGVSGIGSGVNPLITQNIENNIQQANQGDFEQKLKAALNEKDDTKLKQAAKDLEAVFINEIFKEMRKTIQKSDLVEQAPGSDMYESMFDEQVAELSSKGKGYGLADVIYKQLSEKIKNEAK